VNGDSILCGVVLLSLGMGAWSQDMNEVRVGANDRTQARQSKNVFHRAQPANTVRGTASRGQEELLTLRSSPALKASDASSNRSGVRYPGDLTFQGGTVVDSAESHAIYLLPNGKCPISQCWGNPEGFLRDLAESRFIHLVANTSACARANATRWATERKLTTCHRRFRLRIPMCKRLCTQLRPLPGKMDTVTYSMFFFRRAR